VAVTCASGAEATSAFVLASITEIVSSPTSIARLGLKLLRVLRLAVAASLYVAPARVEDDTSQQRAG
jgi:hypothetical protein